MFEDSQCKPIMAGSGVAALDLKVREGFSLEPGESRRVSMGFRMALPSGIFGCIRTRPNQNGLSGLVVSSTVIDSEFKDVVVCSFTNLGDRVLTIKPYDKAAQMLLLEPLVPQNILGSGN